jgi:type II secretory pathway pseudopilin PulG
MDQAQVSRGEAGYAMAALLVAMALMAVMMSVAMPVWRQAAQREKEAELVWRGQQYDRALQLYRRKSGVPGAPNLDVLIQQKFLRKKYKDPITGGDFDLKPVSLIGPGSDTPGVPGMGNRRPGVGNAPSGVGGQTSGFGSQSGGGLQGTGMQGAGVQSGARGSRTGSENQTSGGGRQPFGRAAQTDSSGERTSNQLIGGVRSKSKARSIRELNGRNRYDQWEFVYVPYNPNPLAPGVGGTPPGQQPRLPGQQQRPGSSRPGSTPRGSQRPGSTGSAIQ